MGHYLSEMESDDSFRNRTIYQPMREDLDVYDQEVKRGLVHTEDYSTKMEEYRTKLRAAGWNV